MKSKWNMYALLGEILHIHYLIFLYLSHVNKWQMLAETLANFALVPISPTCLMPLMPKWANAKGVHKNIKFRKKCTK